MVRVSRSAHSVEAEPSNGSSARSSMRSLGGCLMDDVFGGMRDEEKKVWVWGMREGGWKGRPWNSLRMGWDGCQVKGSC